MQIALSIRQSFEICTFYLFLPNHYLVDNLAKLLKFGGLFFIITPNVCRGKRVKILVVNILFQACESVPIFEV